VVPNTDLPDGFQIGACFSAKLQISHSAPRCRR
jgi:hypothetical protein